MLKNMSESGNPLPAWVQSKITNASDYITTVHDYLKYDPETNESKIIENGLMGTLNDTQLANIKKVWANKTMKDVTPGVKAILNKMDLPTKIAVKQANINILSDLVLKEELELDENTIQKIYQMQQDGETLEDIAKQLKLKTDLVKKILGEDKEWATSPTAKTLEEALSDTQISMLKKEYDPLKGKTITSAQYQQLKNLLFKLQDGDLEKLQKQNIPFASSGAATILRVRKAPVKVTKVTVPGLEGMAEGAKRYREMDNVGTSKYTVSFHDGVKKHNDGSDFFDMKIFNNKEVKNKFITDLEKKGYRPAKPFSGEEVEETKDKKSDTEIMYKLLGQAMNAKPYSDEQKKIIKQLNVYRKKLNMEPMEESAELKTETHFNIGQHVIYHAPKNPVTPIKAQIIGLENPQVGAYYKIKKADGETIFASPDQIKLDEACWTGYKQVGLKKKNGRMVPNCVPEETLREQKRLYIESIVAVKNKAEKSGMPYSILKQVYNRGMAAWKGGHRPGATQVQWALARVNSFITKSSGTWGGADSDLAKKVRGS